MKTHEQIRELLPLAAAGELTHPDAEAVRRHVAECAGCSGELRILGQLMPELASLPFSAAPAYLAQRTVARVVRSQEAADAERWDDRILGLLAAFSWALSLATWPIIHLASGIGLLQWLGFSLLFTWVTAGSVAVILWSGTDRRGRKYESLS